MLVPSVTEEKSYHPELKRKSYWEKRLPKETGLNSPGSGALKIF
jgi:hypothetical protein